MKMLISGNWVDAANRATIDVTNPYDGKLLETVPNAAKEDVDRAIADAVTAQKQWNRVIVRERAKILRRYLELLTEYRDELARTLTLETGKPIFDSYGEIDSVYMTFESSIEIVKHQYGKTMPMGHRGRLRRRPPGDGARAPRRHRLHRPLQFPRRPLGV